MDCQPGGSNWVGVRSGRFRALKQNNGHCPNGIIWGAMSGATYRTEPEGQHSEVQWRSCAVFGSLDLIRAVPLAATARYPASIVVMSLFIAYQIYRYTLHAWDWSHSADPVRPNPDRPRLTRIWADEAPSPYRMKFISSSVRKDHFGKLGPSRTPGSEPVADRLS